MKFSIIIPTLNEAKLLPKLIKNLNSFKNDSEVIVVDCGSSDNTIKYAGNADVKLLTDFNGRGSQMNTGVKEADCDVLLFVHADTQLPKDTFEKIEELFCSPSVQI